MTKRVYLIHQVRDLAIQQMEAPDIARTLNASLNTVRTYLSTLRSSGEIGFYDGRTLRSTKIPQPHMLLRLPCELRDLIDIEAHDRQMKPIDLVHTILAKAMKDQELIDYVFGDE